jgi:DNA repair protein RadA/Sms
VTTVPAGLRTIPADDIGAALRVLREIAQNNGQS